MKALDWALENAPWSYANRVYIVTDSQYVTNCRTSARYWKKTVCRNESGEQRQMKIYAEDIEEPRQDCRTWRAR